MAIPETLSKFGEFQQALLDMQRAVANEARLNLALELHRILRDGKDPAETLRMINLILMKTLEDSKDA